MPMPKMGVDPEQVKAPKPVTGGWYTLKLTGFRPKLSKDKQSVNLNGQLEVVNGKPDDNGHKVFCGLNTKFARLHADFSHALGFPLKPDGTLQGDWVPDPNDPENVEKAQYRGPLLGKTMEAELAVTSYMGNERNEIKQAKCKIDGCAVKFPEIKHMTSWIGNK